MDISKASNFERFVFDLLGRDGARTQALFRDALNAKGAFSVSADEFARIPGFGFVSGRSTHADRVATISRCFEAHGVMIDTHTADGLKVALEHRQEGVPMIVLETALPAKFVETLREALGADVQPPRPAALADLESRPRRVTVMPADVQQVKAFVQAHVTVA